MATKPHGAKPPSHVAYYVALAGCVLLLVLLTAYLLYFCISKIVELSECESLTQPVTSSTPRPQPSYPVQPVVRESATAMARICKQLPPASNKGDTIFPTSTSPETQQLGPTPTHEPPPLGHSRDPDIGPRTLNEGLNNKEAHAVQDLRDNQAPTETEHRSLLR